MVEGADAPVAVEGHVHLAVAAAVVLLGVADGAHQQITGGDELVVGEEPGVPGAFGRRRA